MQKLMERLDPNPLGDWAYMAPDDLQVLLLLGF